MFIGGISECTKLPWANNTLFFMCLTSVNINQCTSSAISYNNIYFFFRTLVFCLKKKHMRKALLFNLKKSTVESHRMLVEAYSDNALSETTCRDWFRRFKNDNFDLSDKKRENRPRKVEDCQLLFWTRTIPNRKNACRAIGCFSSSHFHAATCHEEGIKRSENECRMNWTIGRWSDAKTHAKFCLPNKKESRSCIGLWQAMKSGSIFRILNARNFGLILSNHQYLPQDQIASEDDAVRLVGSRGCHLLRAIKTWWKLLMFTAITNNWSNCIVLCVKKGRIIEKDMTSWFSSMTTHHRTRQQCPKLLGDTQLGSAIPLTHQTWHLLTITCFRRCATHSLSGTSILTKTSENGLMSGLPRKIRNFFGVVYTNCSKDEKNV